MYRRLGTGRLGTGHLGSATFGSLGYLASKYTKEFFH